MTAPRMLDKTYRFYFYFFTEGVKECFVMHTNREQ